MLHPGPTFALKWPCFCTSSRGGLFALVPEVVELRNEILNELHINFCNVFVAFSVSNMCCVTRNAINEMNSTF
jgi:hypothetical protein